MATLGAPPRRKITTYGKASRRRMAVPNFTLQGEQAQTSYPVHRKSETWATTSPDLSPPPPSKLVPIVRSPVPNGPSPPPANIYEVPDDDDDGPKLVHKRAFTPPAKLKVVTQRRKVKTPSHVSPPKGIYDMPSSEDETSRAPSKKLMPLKQQKMKVAGPVAKTPITSGAASYGDFARFGASSRSSTTGEAEYDKVALAPGMPSRTDPSKLSNTNKDPRVAVIVPKNTEAGTRKKVKLSPENEGKTVLKRKPSNDDMKLARMAQSRSTTDGPAVSKSRLMTKIASRPKAQMPSKQSVPPITPKKLASAPLINTPSPRLTDTEMMDVEPVRCSNSPRALKMWEALLDPAETDKDSDMILVSGVKTGLSRAKGASPLSRPAGISKSPRKLIRRLPKQRLIDVLVEQQDSLDEDDEEDAGSEMPIDSEPFPCASFPAAERSRSQSIVLEALESALNLPAAQSDSQGLQSQGGPKFTYGRQRSHLAEEDLMKALSIEMPTEPPQAEGRRTRRELKPSLKPALNYNEVEEEDSGSSRMVTNVHELRQSGANSRFLDEVDDFLERIGRPGKTAISMRRSGLLELASKMQDKVFARQFRANGMDQKLFVHLGQENDFVAGFLMISLLVSVLMEGGMPHIVGHLRRQGITRLLIRLIDNRSSIAAIAKDRKSNMSKAAQSMLREHGDHILQMSVWVDKEEQQDLQPQVISPRTLALKCLEMMVRQTREAGDSKEIFSKELTTNLFAIMKSASDEQAWDLPKSNLAIDFYLALSALESHSLAAKSLSDEAIWINEYLATVADTLEIALTRPTSGFSELHTLLIRLTVNVTNNNTNASDVFARPPLMSSMGRVILVKFKELSGFLAEEEQSVVIQHLVLVLGMMSNFADCSSSARDSMHALDGMADDPVDPMAQLFADKRDSASQVDSVQEINKNIPFGYLSILLGYMCLHPTISKKVQARLPGKTLRPLVNSIEEFIGYHKIADVEIADEDGYNRNSGLTERLEALVKKLAAMKGK